MRAELPTRDGQISPDFIVEWTVDNVVTPEG